MSIEALTWAFNLAPVPWDETGKTRKPSASCASVLHALANHAGPDGRNAFPTIATLVRYTRLSERTVQTCLSRLHAEGTIRPGDPDIAAAYVRRADRRGNNWDLAMERMRDDLTDEEMDAVGRSNPFLRPWIEQHHAARRAAQQAARDAADQAERGASSAPRDGVQQLHPVSTGCNQRSHGVQPAQERGAAAAPEPSYEPPLEPSSPTSLRSVGRARADAAPTSPDPAVTDTPDDDPDTIPGLTATTSRGDGGNSTGVHANGVHGDAPKVGRKTAIPAGFGLTPAMRAWAAKDAPTVDVEAETAKFRDHALANDRRYVSWEAAWRNWLRKSADIQAVNAARGGRRPGNHLPPTSGTEDPIHQQRREMFG